MVQRIKPTALQLAVTAVLLLTGAVVQRGFAEAAAQPAHILNPLGDPPIHLGDPFIFTDAKRYFLFGIASSSQGFQCYESFDLVNWKPDGWAWKISGLRAAKGELHAPQVFTYQGMYCLVYSARMPTGVQLALAAAVQPQGPYHDLHVPWLDLGEGCTSGFVFVDSGKAFLFFGRQPEGAGSGAIYGVALNQDLSKRVGSPVTLLKPDQRWELAGKDFKRTIDSARVFKIGSKYYLTYTAIDPTTSDSGIGYATADKPLGPWIKNPDNPMLAERTRSGLVRPAKGSVFPSLDRRERFIVYQTAAQSTSRIEETVVNIDRLVLVGIRQLSVEMLARPGQTPSAAR
jgi:beta-xylosidase